jgi:hypothetical protein
MTLDVQLEADIRTYIDLGTRRPNIGISLSSTVEEALEIVNDKGVRRLEGIVKVKNPLARNSLELYVHSLPADVLSPLVFTMCRATQPTEDPTVAPVTIPKLDIR